MSLPNIESLPPVGSVASTSARGGSPVSSSPPSSEVSSITARLPVSSGTSLPGLFQKKGQQMLHKHLPSSERAPAACFSSQSSLSSVHRSPSDSSSCQAHFSETDSLKSSLRIPQSTFCSSSLRHPVTGSSSPSLDLSAGSSVSGESQPQGLSSSLPSRPSSGSLSKLHRHVCTDGIQRVQSSSFHEPLQVKRKLSSSSDRVNDVSSHTSQCSSALAGVRTPGCCCDCLSLPDCMPVCLHHKKPSSLASLFFFDLFLLAKIFSPPRDTSLSNPFSFPSPSKALDSSLCFFLPGFPLLFAITTAGLLLSLYFFIPGIRVVLFLIASLPLFPVWGLGLVSSLLFFFSWLAVRLVSMPT